MRAPAGKKGISGADGLTFHQYVVSCPYIVTIVKDSQGGN